jgi:hypothetical protein
VEVGDGVATTKPSRSTIDSFGTAAMNLTISFGVSFVWKHTACRPRVRDSTANKHTHSVIKKRHSRRRDGRDATPAVG